MKSGTRGCRVPGDSTAARLERGVPQAPLRVRPAHPRRRAGASSSPPSTGGHQGVRGRGRRDDPRSPGGGTPRPGGSKRRRIADVLPVEFEPVRFPIQPPQRPTPFVPGAGRRPRPAPDRRARGRPARQRRRGGRSRPTTRAAQPKPLYWYYPVTKLKPAAEVFLVHPTARRRPTASRCRCWPGTTSARGTSCSSGSTTRGGGGSTRRTSTSAGSGARRVRAGVPRMVGTKLTQLSLDTPTRCRARPGRCTPGCSTRTSSRSTADEIEATLERLDADPNDKDAIRDR